MVDELGTKLLNCPFCHHSPQEPDHYLPSKQTFARGADQVTFLCLACTHVMPEEDMDPWPYAFCLLSEVSGDGDFKDNGGRAIGTA